MLASTGVYVAYKFLMNSAPNRYINREPIENAKSAIWFLLMDIRITKEKKKLQRW